MHRGLLRIQATTDSSVRVMAVSISMVRALVEMLEQSGVAREKFLGLAGFDLEKLEQRDARVPACDYGALQELALDFTKDEALGLHMAEAADSFSYDLVAHLVGCAATLRDGIETLLEFHALLMDRRHWRLLEESRTATLLYWVGGRSSRCQRFNAEFTMTAFVRMLRHFARRARPERVAFQHCAPAYSPEYTRIFEGSERFEQPFTGIVFDRTLLGCAPLHADAELHAALRAEAEKRVARIRRKLKFSDRVRDYLLERATPDRRDMDAAARALGISARSLRRRLAEEGSCYSVIVEESLAVLAKRLLWNDDSSIEAIAYTMGFSDPSAFYRAFRRWTGTTPKLYRSVRHSG